MLRWDALGCDAMRCDLGVGIGVGGGGMGTGFILPSRYGVGYVESSSSSSSPIYVFRLFDFSTFHYDIPGRIPYEDGDDGRRDEERIYLSKYLGGCRNTLLLQTT